MPSAGRGPSEPQIIFLIHAAIAAGASLVAYALVVYLNGSGSLGGSGVTLGEILGTLVGVTGITVPLTLTYLSVRNSDLQRSLKQMITDSLRKNGLDATKLALACVSMGDETSRTKPSETLLALRDLLDATDGNLDDGVELGDRVKKWLIPSERGETILQYYFEHNGSLSALRGHLWLVGLAAGLCFLIMCWRYMGAQPLPSIEMALVAFSVAMNLATYRFIAKTIACGVELKGILKKQVGNACEIVKTEVASVIATAENLQKSVTPQLPALPAPLTPPEAAR
jgi:hypothetical protein